MQPEGGLPNVVPVAKLPIVAKIPHFNMRFVVTNAAAVAPAACSGGFALA
jgi:hypothetical protein